MSNERLRASVYATGLPVNALAERLEVDPKTVQRWLSGRIPHPGSRHAVAALLQVDEEYLWPGVNRTEFGATSATAEIVAAYPHRADVDVSQWWALLTQTRRQLDLLGYTLYFLPEQHPRFVELLLDRAKLGCSIRLVIADPTSEHVRLRDEEEGGAITLPARIETTMRAIEPLRGQANIEIRNQNAPLYNSVFRFDDEMLVTPHLYATPGNRAPLLHLRRLGPAGIFSGFAGHFDKVWHTAT